MRAQGNYCQMRGRRWKSFSRHKYQRTQIYLRNEPKENKWDPEKYPTGEISILCMIKLMVWIVGSEEEEATGTVLSILT